MSGWIALFFVVGAFVVYLQTGGLEGQAHWISRAMCVAFLVVSLAWMALGRRSPPTAR